MKRPSSLWSELEQLSQGSKQDESFTQLVAAGESEDKPGVAIGQLEEEPVSTGRHEEEPVAEPVVTGGGKEEPIAAG